MAAQTPRYHFRYHSNGAFPLALHCWQATTTDKKNCPTVIALHGFTGSGLDFEALATSPWGEGFNWICPDLPGHDPQQCPDLADAYLLPPLLNALAKLASQCGNPPPALLGYSMGGRIALHAAVRLSSSFSSLTTIGASPGIADPAERRQRQLNDNLLAQQILQEGTVAFAGYWEQQPLIKTQQHIPLQTLAKLQARRRLKQPHGLAYALWCLGNGTLPALHNHLNTIKIPCLFIAGNEDNRYKSLAKQMIACTINAQFYAINEAAHCAHLEKTEIFMQKWSEWTQIYCSS